MIRIQWIRIRNTGWYCYETEFESWRKTLPFFICRQLANRNFVVNLLYLLAGGDGHGDGGQGVGSEAGTAWGHGTRHHHLQRQAEGRSQPGSGYSQVTPLYWLKFSRIWNKNWLTLPVLWMQMHWIWIRIQSNQYYIIKKNKKNHLREKQCSNFFVYNKKIGNVTETIFF